MSIYILIYIITLSYNSFSKSFGLSFYIVYLNFLLPIALLTTTSN